MPKSKTRTRTPAQIIADAKRPEKEVTVCFRADLAVAVDALTAELIELQERNRTDKRLGGVSAEERALAQQIVDLETEAEDNSVTFLIRALPRPDWRKAREACPPSDQEKDDGWAVDRDKLTQLVLADSVVRPELDSDSLQSIVHELAEGQWAKIRTAVLEVNGGDGSIPFSKLASLILRSSSPEGESRELTESASAASTGGSPAR